MAKTYYVIRRGNEFLTSHGLQSFSWIASTTPGMAPGVSYTETYPGAVRLALQYGAEVVTVLYVDGFLVIQPD